MVLSPDILKFLNKKPEEMESAPEENSLESLKAKYEELQQKKQQMNAPQTEAPMSVGEPAKFEEHTPKTKAPVTEVPTTDEEVQAQKVETEKGVNTAKDMMVQLGESLQDTEKLMKELDSEKKPSKESASKSDILEAKINEFRKLSEANVKQAQWADAVINIANMINANYGGPQMNSNFAAQAQKDQMAKLKLLQDEYKNLKKEDKGKVFSTKQGLIKVGDDGEAELLKVPGLEETVGSSKDPNSAESKKAQDQLIALYKLNNLKFDPNQIRKLSADMIGSKLATAGIRKAEKGIEGTREERLGKKFDWQRDEREDLSTKETETVAGFDNVIQELENIKKLKKGVNTGPYVSRTQAAKEYVPGASMDTDFAKLQARSGQTLFDYIKQQSGTAFTDRELDALEKQMPNVTLDDTTFNSVLDTIEEKLKEKKDRYLKTLEVSKEKASQFRDTGKKQGVSVVTPEGSVQQLSGYKVVGKTRDGRLVVEDSSGKKKALKKGYSISE